MTDLAVTTEAGVLRLHIDREPKRNALNGDVLRGAVGFDGMGPFGAVVALASVLPFTRLVRRDSR